MSHTSVTTISNVEPVTNLAVELPVKRLSFLEFLKRVNWVECSPFLLIHLLVITAFFVPFSWNYVALATGLYVLRMFAITAGYHRYFSHRTYKVNRFTQFILAFLGGTAIQKGALWWAANHRHHHRYSDKPEDLHSPRRGGLFWAHIGWVMTPEFNETRWELIPDLKKYPELVFINKHYLIPPVTLGVLLFAFGGVSALVWGLVVSTVFVWHGTFTINSLSHTWGTQRYETGDDSRNNPILAIVTLGEGWHNNHHCYQASTRQGFFWWEYDISYYILKILSWVGIVSGIKEPPLTLLESKRKRLAQH